MPQDDIDEGHTGAQSASILLSIRIARHPVRPMNTKTREWVGFEAVPVPAKHDGRIPKRCAAPGLLSPAEVRLEIGSLLIESM